ncbi:MAG: DUF1858 domain-containing protein [Chloroflexi bacterium]|nr:DUF1858 domain-containing protein [Chloroflexota bacterium]
MSEEILITEMMVKTILERWPQTAEVFNYYSSACIGCAIAPFCTITDAAKIYGLSLEAFADDVERAIDGQKLSFN